MKTSSNTNNIESKKVQLDDPKGKVNGMSQVINILTGETKKIRCHYISHRTDRPVSRVLTLERLNHPALTAAGVTAWAERFNDGVNSFDWLRVSIQLTDKICFTPNCANVGLPDVENYGNLDYYMGQEGAMRVSMNNVDKFFQSIADKPAKMMTGEDWPNMAVIAAYKAAGRDEEADTLTAARDTYNARREADKEAWSKKYAAQQYYYNSPKPKNFDELTELERAQFMMQTAQECAKDHPELDWADILEKAEKRLEKAQAERQERYNARCKELEVEALAQMPYKVGDTVKSRDGVTGRVVEMHPEVTGDIDSPHLIYEYDGKPTVNVVILDADGKRHCAHWSFFTLQETSEITDGTEVWTTIELHEEYGKRGKVVRRFFADHGVWCLDIEFEDGTTACYAEEYVTTEKPWAVVGAKCKHKYLNRDVVLTITAVGQYYGIKAESEDGKVERCGLVRDFEPVEDGEAEKAAKVKETYKTGLLVTDKKYGHDYERITGIEEGMNTYIVTTATKIQVECMKHHCVMEKAKNEHTVADLPEWVRPGAVLMINGTWKWEEVVIVELADGCVWYKKGNSVMGWTYDHFISLYVNHHYAKVKEYAPEPTLEDIGKFRALCEAEGCTYPGDVEGTIEYYRDALLTAAEGQTVSYQFGNCRFDCKRNESGTWDVHAYDTDGEDTTFEGRTASFFGGMFNDLFKTWGSGNLPSPDDIESLTAKYAKQIEESALLGCGCMVGDGDESRKDSKCMKVRTAYKNDSHDAKDWTYCVSWYKTAPAKGDADGQRQTLRECENGVRLEQAARHMAYFELMARKGWTLDEILYGKAA